MTPTSPVPTSIHIQDGVVTIQSHKGRLTRVCTSKDLRVMEEFLEDLDNMLYLDTHWYRPVSYDRE